MPHPRSAIALLVEFMEKKIEVKCECEGTGFIAIADNGGFGVEHVECGQHHPAFQDAPATAGSRVRVPAGILLFTISEETKPQTVAATITEHPTVHCIGVIFPLHRDRFTEQYEKYNPPGHSRGVFPVLPMRQIEGLPEGRISGSS